MEEEKEEHKQYNSKLVIKYQEGGSNGGLGDGGGKGGLGT